MLSRASIAREEKSVTAFKASNRLILQLGANVPGDSELKAMLPYYPPYPRALKLILNLFCSINGLNGMTAHLFTTFY